MREMQQSLCILVVDDNLLNLKLLATTLDNHGYKTLMAMDGPTARHFAENEKPDLILLDVKMPDEDGFEVIKQLKSNPVTSAIPVIFLSGLSELESKLTGFELGAVDYITKPFHPLEVLARVRLHLKLSIATNSLIINQADKLKQITEAQTSMLTTPETQPGAGFGVYYCALEEAGGDFYDVLPVSSNIYGYFVGDFSGHDIKTSYLTSSVKALLKQNCTPVYRPMESIKIINDVLLKILPEEKYLTACYACLNRKTKHMTIINAGHPPVVYIPAGEVPRFINLKGDVLGSFRDVSFGRESLKVSKGDRFFIYSDGLIESTQKKILWPEGSADLLEACQSVGGTNINAAPDKIAEIMNQGKAVCEDDVIVLGIEV
ncbi:MAG: fused response regulator/phosphatase [Thermodesulfobacteriota bacterium]|nr:fused response regulator/phosphatase [Thermodesulfobacteriota bacterium]